MLHHLMIIWDLNLVACWGGSTAVCYGMLGVGSCRKARWRREKWRAISLSSLEHRLSPGGPGRCTMRTVTAQRPGGTSRRAVVSQEGGKRSKGLLRQVLSPPGKPPESQGQRAVLEELEGRHGAGSYRAGQGAPALLLDGSIRDPPVQGCLRLEAILLHLHLGLGLCHLLQTLQNKQRELIRC